MTRRDRNNLKFLLKAGPKTIEHWYSQASDDDIRYAEDLLYLHELELIDSKVRTAKDCKDAKRLLKKFTKV